MTVTDLIRRAELGCTHAKRLAARHLARRCDEAAREAAANPAMRATWRLVALNWSDLARRLDGTGAGAVRATVRAICI